ncbi:transmembrane protease serine 12-like isoform X1 [Protopterus annectens]|uniref:transmembrane protease serine 12-like isoform X1 n=1 Tax=Protopterus annectens TaxID=7888 RepID=UPI001CFB4097|nr:transmembrane protease serine 12-like isoform X1 [Protopterus annectens]
MRLQKYLLYLLLIQLIFPFTVCYPVSLMKFTTKELNLKPPWTRATEAMSSASRSKGCGLRPLMKNPSEVSLPIVKGRTAVVGEWPWQVSLQHYRTKSEALMPFCGGALINEHWVLSAAHCFESSFLRYPDMVHVVAGTNRFSETPEHTEIPKASLIILHDGFGVKGEGFIHDIALVKLERPIEFSDSIQPICIPTSDTLETFSKCFISGWGVLDEFGEYSDELLTSEIKVTTTDICNETGMYAGILTEDVICAGEQFVKDEMYKGDIGSPFSCFNHEDSRFYLLGISSWGADHGAMHLPQIYTKTSSYACWIGTSTIKAEKSSVDNSVTQNVPSWTSFASSLIVIFHLS